MYIFPAIDLRNGECVRLVQGDFGTAEKVAEDPLETARRFEAQGAHFLHMVDLDGALDAKPRNRALILSVAKQTRLNIELGGGIRSLDTAADYLQNGIHRVILGSAAVRDPALVKQAVAEFGDRIAVGIDAKNGMVASDGWLDVGAVDYLSLAQAMCAIGVKHIIFTDIARDGTLDGPNLEQLERLSRTVPAQITASGGICHLDDIRALKRLNLYAAICGKSLYRGTLDLTEALRVAHA